MNKFFYSMIVVIVFCLGIFSATIVYTSQNKDILGVNRLAVLAPTDTPPPPPPPDYYYPLRDIDAISQVLRIRDNGNDFMTLTMFRDNHVWIYDCEVNDSTGLVVSSTCKPTSTEYLSSWLQKVSNKEAKWGNYSYLLSGDLDAVSQSLKIKNKGNDKVTTNIFKGDRRWTFDCEINNATGKIQNCIAGVVHSFMDWLSFVKPFDYNPIWGRPEPPPPPSQ